MEYQNGMKFTTLDRDNDLSSNTNCAQRWRGAWWYHECHKSNLNGLYPTTSATGAEYMSWYFLYQSFGNVIYSDMKIKFHR